MCEPNLIDQGPLMEASVPPSNKGGGSNGEFIVHTKHTCDNCFRRPIIGQRFTSSVRPNFDLCALCYDGYSGPDIGLAEEALIRDKKLSRDFVLKLKISYGGEVQTRRVKVSEIWGKKSAKLNFAKLLKLAAGFALPENKVDEARKAKATYVDEDGDEISMTTNNELYDAFIHLFEMAKPFIITVTIPQDEAGKSSVAHVGKVKGMSKRIQTRKVESSKKAFTVPVQMDKPRNMGEGKSSDFFIHARHTCDGCQKTPIVGTRYHATKIPDFDLCSACFKKYEGDDLDFKPEVQERDRRMQQRWLNKQGLSHACTQASIAGMWEKANGDLADFLKKVEESVASIESASVYHASGPCKGAPVSEFKSSADLPSSVDLAEFLKKVKDSGSSIGSVTVYQMNGPPTKIDVGTSNKAIEPPNVEAEAPDSTTKSHDESFLSDADGNGSIAEAIGKTLDVCVAAIEAAIIEELGTVHFNEDNAKPQMPFESKAAHNEDVSLNDDAIATAPDALWFETERVDGTTEAAMPLSTEGANETSKEPSCTEANETEHLEQAKCKEEKMEPKVGDMLLHPILTSASSAPLLARGSIPPTCVNLSLDKMSGSHEEIGFIEIPKVEDASDGEDDWSVLSDNGEMVKHNGEKSRSTATVISPVVLAKWDTELHQLHEMGFLDDRSNVDSLEHLEAAYMGVDSTDKVTVNSVVEHILSGLV